MTEHDAYLALNLVPSMGAATARAGIARFGSAAAFFESGGRGLADLDVDGRRLGRARAAAFEESFGAVDWRAEAERAARSSLQVVTPADEAYPPLLRAIHAPPLALYVAGSAAALAAPRCVAVVGTRSPTPYGRDVAKDFSYRLALAGATIVSGLARGVDTLAAEGALLAGRPTVAVVGSALDRLYPPENRELARRIVAGGGAVVSEYPFGRAADRQTFPMRNRIISGLCRGTLCVEAGLTSGTLITAEHAMEQGRSVMAVPGRVTDPSALGCLKLLRDGARLVQSPEDVLDELDSLPGLSPVAPASPRPSPPPPRLREAGSAPGASAPGPAPSADPEERKILDALARCGELQPDAVVSETGLPAYRVGPLLIALEMKSLVRRSPDGSCSLRRV